MFCCSALQASSSTRSFFSTCPPLEKPDSKDPLVISGVELPDPIARLLFDALELPDSIARRLFEGAELLDTIALLLFEGGDPRFADWPPSSSGTYPK